MKNQQISLTSSINLRGVQKDLYDIDTLFLNQVRELLKTSKREKIRWQVLSGTEHAIALSFGIIAIVDMTKRDVFMSLLETSCMGLSAGLGFKAIKCAKTQHDAHEQLQHILDTTVNFLNIANAQEIKQIADIVRNQHTQNSK